MRAVAEGQVHELAGADILSPGLSVIIGLRQVHDIVQAYMQT
jgi:hypothetical protein